MKTILTENCDCARCNRIRCAEAEATKIEEKCRKLLASGLEPRKAGFRLVVWMCVKAVGPKAATPDVEERVAREFPGLFPDNAPWTEDYLLGWVDGYNRRAVDHYAQVDTTVADILGAFMSGKPK